MDKLEPSSFAGTEVSHLEDTVDKAGNYTMYCEIRNEVNNITISRKVILKIMSKS